MSVILRKPTPKAIKVAAITTSAVVVALSAPAIFVSGIGALGFGPKGIVAGSLAAAWMKSYKGAIPAGSLISVLQSVGVAGLGTKGVCIAGGFGAAIGAATGAGLNALSTKVTLPKSLPFWRNNNANTLEGRPFDVIREESTPILLNIDNEHGGYSSESNRIAY